MGMFADTIQAKFDEAIEKVRKERKQTMAKVLTIHTADNRIFKLKVEPSVLKRHAEVTIHELRGGIRYSYCKTCTFDVMEYDTIAEGAVAMLHTYLAEIRMEDEIAEKWKEFERNA